MRVKKKSIVLISTIIVLLLLIVTTVNNILGKEKKEVSIAKEFIGTLYDDNIIEKNYITEIDVVDKENSTDKLTNKNSQNKYSVIVSNYGIDIDNDYRILGFFNKNLENQKYNTYRSNEITEEKAIELAKTYINKITDDEFSFKTIKNNEENDSIVYNITFYKYRNGHPFYKREINTLINKITGKLEGYSNYPLEEEINYIEDINIKEKDAIKLLNNKFRSLDIDIKIEESKLYYINVSENDMVLSYVFNLKIEEKEDLITAFVRADTGEIIINGLESISKN